MSVWGRKRKHQQWAAPQRIGIDDLYTRPVVDGLKVATDVQPARVPMDGTLVMLSMSGLTATVRLGFHRTLEDILRLRECER